MTGDAATELLREALATALMDANLIHYREPEAAAMYADALLPVVEAECRRRAAEELRAIADEWQRRGWEVATLEAIHSRADAIDEETV